MGNDLLEGIGGEFPRTLERAAELEQLARRLDVCAGRVEEVLRRCADLQLYNWRSPAGNAYRERVAGHAAVLRGSLNGLADAGLALRSRARDAPEGTAGSPLRWP